MCDARISLTKGEAVAALVDMPTSDTVKAVLVLGVDGSVTMIAKRGMTDDPDMQRIVEALDPDTMSARGAVRVDDPPQWVARTLLELANRQVDAGNTTA